LDTLVCIAPAGNESLRMNHTNRLTASDHHRIAALPTSAGIFPTPLKQRGDERLNQAR
jgi:hypothetical protein